MPSRDVGGVAANCRVRQSARWHARREFELLKLVAHEGSEETRELFLRLRLQKHHTPPEAKQAAGRRAKPAPARAQTVPKQKTAAQLARSERNRERLGQKHLARVAKVLPRLQAWLRRARASLEQRMELTLPVPPTGTSAAAPPPPPALAAEAQPSATPLTALWLTVRIATRLMALCRRARLHLRSGYPLDGWYFRPDQARKDKLNAVAAAWCAKHDPLHPPACTQLLAPSTPPRSRRAAAEVASRATKRDALADSPSRAPAHPKKTRAVGSLQAALAAAAPPQPPHREPITATNYAAYALAAAAHPHSPSA